MPMPLCDFQKLWIYWWKLGTLQTMVFSFDCEHAEAVLALLLRQASACHEAFMANRLSMYWMAGACTSIS